MAHFGPVVTAMVTPFDDDLDLDTRAAAVLAEWLVENGSDALVVAGTTGEAPTLSDAELLALARSVSEAVSAPVLVGVGTNSTAHAVEMARRVTETGVDGILCVTPYYNRPSQEGIARHFTAVAEAVDGLPVVLYDHPVRTGRKIQTDTILGLARDVPNIVGLKDAAARPDLTAALMAQAPQGFELYSGDDALTLPLLAVGAVGAISVAAHWCGRQIGEMIAAFGKGDPGTARRINAHLIESYDFETSEAAPNPLPTKALLRALGLPVGGCRPPMGPEPEHLAERARSVLANLS